MIRQGDILIVPASRSDLRGAKRVKRIRNVGFIVAEGEATGHHHKISTRGVKMFERNGTLFLEVPAGGAEFEHDEHDTLTIPRGIHEVRRQREYVPPRRASSLPTFRRVYD